MLRIAEKISIRAELVGGAFVLCLPVPPAGDNVPQQVAGRVRAIDDRAEYDNFFRGDGVNVAGGKFDITAWKEKIFGQINFWGGVEVDSHKKFKLATWTKRNFFRLEFGSNAR